MSEKPPLAALFVTCLIDLFRPVAGFAAIRLLERAGCRVEVPVQSCCGQPAYNSGDRANARALAARNLDIFQSYDYVVAPSGSCASMLRNHYPLLFAGDPRQEARARDLAARSHELLSFLTEVMGVERVEASYPGTVAYHDSCSGLRELGIREQPRLLLGSVEGLVLAELSTPEACCGFGGTFCVSYPEIAGRIVAEKTADIAATGAGTVTGGDLGCLLNIAARQEREGKPIACRHVAEILAGMTEESPPIGCSGK